jgi:hypothetical protein
MSTPCFATEFSALSAVQSSRKEQDWLTRARIAPVALLLVLCGLMVLLRLHTYDEPLERDITTYAVIGHELLGGKALYTQLWDHKPPAIYVTYAAAELLSGYGRDSIFLINIAASIATLFGCYFAGSGGTSGRAGGIFAAVAWLVASGDLALEANQPNTELFLNAFLTAAFAIIVRRQNTPIRPRIAFLVGGLFAIASLYKQVVVPDAALLTVVYVASAQAGKRSVAIKNVGIIVGVGLSVWVLTWLYFFVQGRAGAFMGAVFTYNSYYSGNLWQNLTHSFIPRGASPDLLAVLIPSASLLVVAGVLGLIFGPRRQWIYLLAWALGTHLAVLLPGRFFPHYYQLWLPLLAVATGWGAALLARVLPPRLSALGYVVGLAVCAMMAMVEAPFYTIPASAWSVKKYGTIFNSSEQLASNLDQMLLPKETFYEWGSESGMYFTSKRQPPSGVLFAEHMLGGPFARILSQRLIRDLEQNKPEVIIANRRTLAYTPASHPVIAWFAENYRPFSATKDFLLFARRGGRLEEEMRRSVQ